MASRALSAILPSLAERREKRGLTVLAEILPAARALLVAAPALIDADAIIELGLARVFAATSGLFPAAGAASGAATARLFRRAVEFGRLGMAAALWRRLPAERDKAFLLLTSGAEEEEEEDGKEAAIEVALARGDRRMLRWMARQFAPGRDAGGLGEWRGEFVEWVIGAVREPELAEELLVLARPSLEDMAGTLARKEIYQNGLFEWITEHYAFDLNFLRKDPEALSDFIYGFAPSEIKALVWLFDDLGLTREALGDRWLDLMSTTLTRGSLPAVCFLLDRLGATLGDLSRVAFDGRAAVEVRDPAVRAWLDRKFAPPALAPEDYRRLAEELSRPGSARPGSGPGKLPLGPGR